MTEVTLNNGERVKLTLNSVCFEKQTFVRVGQRLIAGIVTDEPDEQCIYIWREANGIYRYLGDIVFKEQGDGSVVWSIYTATNNTKFSKQAAHFLAQQGERYIEGDSPNEYSSMNSHIEMLSKVSE